MGLKDFRRDLIAFAKKLETLGPEVESFVRKELFEVGRKARDRAAQLTPVDTGDTKNAWAVQPLQRGLGFRVFNGSDRANKRLSIKGGGTTSLLEILEFGSKEHKIDGNPGLAFFWEKKGVDFVGRKVDHPGTDPYAMMGQATIEARLDMDILTQNLERMIGKV